MPTFVWTEDLLVGVPSIDGQHRELIHRINRLLDACMTGASSKDFTETVDFLQQYVVEHFADEERLMRGATYPALAEHLTQHQYFIEQFQALRAELDRGIQPHLVLRANRILVTWLRSHICIVDRALGAFLRGQRPGELGDEAEAGVAPEAGGGAEAPEPEPAGTWSLEDELRDVTRQVAVALGGDFTGSVRTLSTNESVQKLSHTLSFLMEAFRGQAREADERGQQLAAQLETVEQQRRAIYELGTPILELWHGILVLPVIGFVDSRRAQQVMERLLEDVCAKRADFVIIDVTGVAVMDTQTADYFSKIFHSLRLLGSQPVLTGIQPSVAQTLVSLGVTLEGVLTLRSLQQGFQECLRLSEARRSARGAAALTPRRGRELPR